uniref:Uncharacterized protein n=1 Tax=Molossus molossus TaxID=27622 RepID=A0A7J8I3U7_MOLMO|nr:hypothetical protein HJG59_001886 [Molossus molossus]
MEVGKHLCVFLHRGQTLGNRNLLEYVIPHRKMTCLIQIVEPPSQEAQLAPIRTTGNQNLALWIC